MGKKLIIDGREVAFNASAASPRIYRRFFGRDLIQDFAKIRKAYNNIMKKRTENMTPEELEDEQFSVIDLQIFENFAYTLAWQADHSIPENPEEWLDQFSSFSIYEILPELLSLWAENNKTINKAKNV